MDSCFRALCMTFVLAAFSRRSGAAGPVIKCEPCDAGTRLLCKPLPKDCTEKVREPGCGCCMTCALSHGQPCGVYTGRCGSGLSCQHQPGEAKPLQALLEGRGICANATSKRLTARPTAPVNEVPGRPSLAFYAPWRFFFSPSLSPAPLFSHFMRLKQCHQYVSSLMATLTVEVRFLERKLLHKKRCSTIL